MPREQSGNEVRKGIMQYLGEECLRQREEQGEVLEVEMCWVS